MQLFPFLGYLNPNVVFLCLLPVHEQSYFLSQLIVVSFSPPSTSSLVFQSLHSGPVCQWPWLQWCVWKWRGTALAALSLRSSASAGAPCIRACAFTLPLFVLLNDRPKTCLEMLNNCCNYPVFLKSLFICVTLPTNAIHLWMKQHRYKCY